MLENETEKFLRRNIRAGVRNTSSPKKTGEIFRKTEYSDIEEYLYVLVKNDGTRYTSMLTEEILSQSGMSVAKIWRVAENNSKKDVLIAPYYKKPFEMYICTFRSDGFRGAITLLNKNLLKDFARKKEWEKMIVFPVSVHFIILIPCTEKSNSATFKNIIEELISGCGKDDVLVHYPIEIEA